MRKCLISILLTFIVKQSANWILDLHHFELHAYLHCEFLHSVTPPKEYVNFLRWIYMMGLKPTWSQLLFCLVLIDFLLWLLQKVGWVRHCKLTIRLWMEVLADFWQIFQWVCVKSQIFKCQDINALLFNFWTFNMLCQMATEIVDAWLNPKDVFIAQ